MPHAALKLVGGANTQETPALNENAGISSANLVRFMYDANGISLVQKLGGWVKFFPYKMHAIVRALWAWEDLNLNSWLAFGTETITGTSSAELGAITSGTLDLITPTILTNNLAPQLTTFAGNPSVRIQDTAAPGITSYNSVYIATQISIGGIILFGMYACDPDGYLGSDTYTIYSEDELGVLNPAISSSTTSVLPTFTTALGSNTVTVNLPNYGNSPEAYTAGNTFPVLMPVSVGGITIYGNYVIQALIDANNFTILANQAPISDGTATLNGGLAQFIYSFGQSSSTPAGQAYGQGPYGGGGYGTGSVITAITGIGIDAVDWTLDNWGQVLIACPDRAPVIGQTPFQPIYQWTPGANKATIITNAPPVNDGIFVAMPQRQIVAWGSTQTGIQDPLLISWCDVGNYNQWIPLVINQAGSYRIPKGSRIVGCIQGPQQGLILTDIDIWSMQYIGPPLVYGFNEIGTGCGLIARKAIGTLNGIAYWMSQSQLYTLSANGVQPLPCPVWDTVFQNIDQNNLQKIRFASNSRFNEVAWYYPSANGGGEVDSYIKGNVLLNVWDYGTLGRSAWVDQSVLGPPIGADPSNLYLYQHETSNDADGQPLLPFFQTGYFSIAEGDMMSFIDLIWPDMKWGQYSQTPAATVQISFLVTDYPGDTPQLFGPYSVTQATQYFNTRLRGRLVAVRISSSDLGTFWRIGNIRYRYAPDGKF